MKKYIIFDLDGTLVESIEGITNLVVEFIKNKFGEDFDEKTRYILSTTKGQPLISQLGIILGTRDDLGKIRDELYTLIMAESKESFYSGVQKKIRELSKKYTLLLSTGNSTKEAKKILEKGGILDCFYTILGNDVIPKGSDHIEKFYDFFGDKDFFKETVYVGNGENDKEIAKKHHIDFIRIGKNNHDEYEIGSIKDIDKVLDEINKKER